MTNFIFGIRGRSTLTVPLLIKKKHFPGSIHQLFPFAFKENVSSCFDVFHQTSKRKHPSRLRWSEELRIDAK